MTASAPPRFRGHSLLREALLAALDEGSLPPTLLIHGAPGCGKQTLALWIARAALCSGHPRPCGACSHCRMSQRIEHPDIHWHFPLPRPKGVSGSARLARAIEDARIERLAEHRRSPLRPVGDAEVKGIYMDAARTIREQSHRRPALASDQIFIVGDAEHLASQEASQEAANALLKLLEEPPENTWFILTTSKPGTLPDTIRSRALPVHLPPLPPEAVEEFLASECGADPAEASRAAALAQGSIGAAIGHLDPEAAQSTQRDRALALLKAATGSRRAGIYAAAIGTDTRGARGLVDMLGALQLWIRDLGAVSVGRRDRIVNVDEAALLADTARRLRPAPDAIADAVARVEDARIMARGNVNPQLLIAGLLLDLEETLRHD